MFDKNITIRELFEESMIAIGGDGFAFGVFNGDYLDIEMDEPIHFKDVEELCEYMNWIPDETVNNTFGIDDVDVQHCCDMNMLLSLKN